MCYIMIRGNAPTNISIYRLEKLQRSPFLATGLVWQLGNLGFEFSSLLAFCIYSFRESSSSHGPLCADPQPGARVHLAPDLPADHCPGSAGTGLCLQPGCLRAPGTLPAGICPSSRCQPFSRAPRVELWLCRALGAWRGSIRNSKSCGCSARG